MDTHSVTGTLSSSGVEADNLVTSFGRMNHALVESPTLKATSFCYVG